MIHGLCAPKRAIFVLHAIGFVFSLSSSAFALCDPMATADSGDVHLRAVSATEVEAIRQAGLAARVRIPSGYDRPAMMAVGDSMYNGVTSLTVDRSREALSVPVQVAAMLGESFRTPAYPRPILVDLEKSLSVGPLFAYADILSNVYVNIAAWNAEYRLPEGQAGPGHASDTLFDNLAASSFTSGNLLCTTAHDANTFWRGIRVTHGPLGLPDNLLNYHEYMNASFLLNPQDRPEFLNVSPMAEVIARRPTRLLINVGSNDGVWKAGFDGLDFNETALDALLKNMASIARLIPDETQYVYISTLVPPSRVPNLRRMSDNKMICNGHVYFTSYQPFLGTKKPETLTGQHACDIDKRLTKLNTDIMNTVQAVLRPRIDSHTLQLRFVPFDDILWNHDHKHYDSPDPHAATIHITWQGDGRELDNRVIRQATGIIPPDSGQGGMTGYDNMHPTMVMYALGAQTVLDQILGAESNRTDQHLRPVANPANLPQCVADVLQTGSASTGCPTFSIASSVLTSLNMDVFGEEDLNLVHQILMLSTTAHDDPRKLATGCVLARYFAIAVGSSTGTSRLAVEAPNSTCVRTVRQLRMQNRFGGY